MSRKALAAAFPATLPVLTGYLFIGVAFGLMMEGAGYNVIWSFFMSLTVYAGSGQYLGVSLLTTAAALTEVAMLTFIVNFRYLVYGLSMFDKFKGMGLKKIYMIFALTDETYALLAGTPVPAEVEPHQFYTAVAVLDQLYWVLGSVLGSVAGALLNFSTEGVEFAMTALFLVIAVDQWKSVKEHLPALLGASCTALCLIIVGAEYMLIPALVILILILLLLRVRLDGAEEEGAPC